MPDFPAAFALPESTTFSTFGRNCLLAVNSMLQNLNATAGAVWPASNRALYIPLWLEQPLTARRIAVVPTVQSGNLDVGIYNSKGDRIVSKGSTAVGAANATQIVDITASVTGTASPVLDAGTYFLALNVDNTTAAFKSSTMTLAEMCRISGVQQQAVGAVTLPNPATFANPASAYAPAILLSGSSTL